MHGLFSTLPSPGEHAKSTIQRMVLFQTVKKPSASLDTVGAAIRRPRNNCEAIVAVFEENKK